MGDTQAWLEAVIKQNERKYAIGKVISYEEHFLVGAGENYMSQVKKTVVRIVRKDGEIVKKSYILKRLPDGVHTRELIHQHGFSFIEFTCYRDVLSSMENLLSEKELPDEPLWPQCITFKPYGEIILEDLTTLGYKMADRIQGVDFDHCSLVMQNLGMFHALGLVLKERGVLSQVAFGEHCLLRMRNEMQSWLGQGFKKLLTSMENWGDEWKPYKAKLERKLDTYVNEVVDLHAPKDDGLIVLIHGDSWVNNMVFKHNIYTGKPINMRFLDFQLTCLSSPAVDLIYFFIGTPNLEVRRQNKRSLLKMYHESLVFNMNRLGVGQSPPSFDYIENEMKRLSLLYIHYMTNLLPIIHKKKGDAWDCEGMLADLKNTTEEAASGKEVTQMKEWLDFDENLIAIFKIIMKEVEDDI